MPTQKRTTSRKAPSKSVSSKRGSLTNSSKKALSAPEMSDSQRAIYNKLRRKGLSEKQAHAFSKHAARRKDQAAARHEKAKSVGKKSKPKTSKK